MKQLKVGIIGFGRSGRNIHTAHFLKDTERFKITAVTDKLEDRKERAERETGCKSYDDYHDFFNLDLDLIVNATPSHLHVPVTEDILKAGYNCVTEKPLAQRAKDVDKLIARAEKSGVMFTVFQQSRFAPYFRKVKEVIDSGVLGRIAQISIAFNGFSRRYDWQTIREFMGGSLLNTGPHPLDQALQFFGTDVMPQVYCHMDRVNTAGDAEDHVAMMLRGEGRPLIYLELSSSSIFPVHTYRVYGTFGSLQGNMKRMEWKYFDPSKHVQPQLVRGPLMDAEGLPIYPSEQLEWTEESWQVPSDQENLFGTISKSYYDMIYSHLTEGMPLEVTPQQVRRQAEVIEECQRQNPSIYS
jgi:scyllo-inositol 2-dehydrogenase (NADP+)